jgi:hypothetical protein
MADLIINDPTVSAFYEPPHPNERIYFSGVVDPESGEMRLRRIVEPANGQPAALKVERPKEKHS